MFWRRRSIVRETVFTLGFALATAFGGSGCAGADLAKLEVPAGGVRLSYDFTPGARFKGHVRRGETIQSSQFSVTRSVECDIDLNVMGEDPNRGDILVKAVVSNVQIAWNLPPTPMYAGINPDAIVAQAQAVVQNMEVRFNVLPNGKVNYMPPAPEEAEPQVKLVIEQVLEGIESAFMEMPRGKVDLGESWDENEKRGRKGKLGRYREGTITTTFDGLYRDEEHGRDVAKLSVKHERVETITTKAGSHENKWDGKTTVLFSTSGNYLAQVTGEVRKFDPGTGGGPQTTFTKVQVNWDKLEATAAPAIEQAAATADSESQAITDPCNPDYVGPEECKDSESQTITDPCNPDYVGPEECKEDGDPGASGTEPPKDAAKPENQGRS